MAFRKNSGTASKRAADIFSVLHGLSHTSAGTAAGASAHGHTGRRSAATHLLFVEIKAGFGVLFKALREHIVLTHSASPPSLS